MAGIYIHVPFCVSKCYYCDFYSVKSGSNEISSYISALSNQIKSMVSGNIDSIFFGGGTPSVLSPAQIGRVIELISDVGRISEDAEITLECNPEDANLNYLTELKYIGINRISLGIQSLSDRVLKTIGRRHDSLTSETAVANAIKAGFDNISADLILCLPGESSSDVNKNIEKLVKMDLPHFSTYMLSIPEGSIFFNDIPRGLSDDDKQAEIYLETSKKLRSLSYEHYEISNFSKPGFHCRHNLKYWKCQDYIGLGPAAHSSISGLRYSFPKSIKLFEETYKHSMPFEIALSTLTPEGRVDSTDYIIMGLRLSEGISLSSLYQLFGHTLSAEKLYLLKEYKDMGLVNYDGDYLSLTLEGFLLSNRIISSII
ncbi:MAG: radical SAM family heme chaperone HemW [Ruminococcaceae bacterium]|nr:radical SAM family heme chaperone HemW [Oscillospiraceae bacterium]